MNIAELSVCTELFHTRAGTAYVDLVIDGHRETWPNPQPTLSGLPASRLLPSNRHRCE
jgi:hypothetical protein